MGDGQQHALPGRPCRFPVDRWATTTMVSQGASGHHPRGASRRRRCLRWAVAALLAPLVALAGLLVIQLARTFAGRIAYPMEVEWMEGGQLYHAYRLLHGLPLYGPCVDGFIPFPYPPVYSTVVAGVGALIGLDFWVGRLVSVTAFTIACVVLCREVAQTWVPGARRWVVAILAAGALAGSFPYTGAWYDLVRVDSVFIAFLFGGAAVSLPPGQDGAVRRRPSPLRIAVCAGLLCGALFAKQTAVFFLPWICLFAIVRDWRSGLWLIGAVATLSLALLGLLQWSSDGMFWTFMVGVMSHHELIINQTFTSALRILMLEPYLPLIGLVALWLWRKGKLRTRVAFWSGMLAAALVASLVTTSKTAAASNNLMTGVLLGGPVALMVVGDLLAATPRRHLAHWLTTLGLTIVGLMLFQAQVFRPDMFVPPPDRWRAARAFNELVASLEGGVVIPAHSFAAIRQGNHNGQMHEQGHVDVLGAGVEAIDVVECVAQLDARWLILNEPSEHYLKTVLSAHYERRGEIPAAAQAWVGHFSRPFHLYERRPGTESLRQRRRTRPLFDFESGGFTGWEQEGDAFRAGPLPARTVYQAPIDGHRGHLLANSHLPQVGDPATGRLRSPEFVIDRSHLGFRVGGGALPGLRVALEVDGQVVREVVGRGQNIEMLVPVAWNVAELLGRRARLVIVDDERGGWGHILVDAVELFDVPVRADGVR